MHAASDEYVSPPMVVDLVRVWIRRASAGRRLTARTYSVTSSEVDPEAYLQENAAIPAPPMLSPLVKVLEAQGEQLVRPSATRAAENWSGHGPCKA